MVKIKIDTEGVSEEEARAYGNFEQPRPGVYRFQITEVNAGYSKDGAGLPDEARPRLEVVFKCLDTRYKGAQVWGYFSLPGHEKYDENAKKKMLQLLMAVGLKGGTGELDTAKLVNKVVKVRVSGKGEGENYRADFSAVFKDDEGGGAELGDGNGPFDDGDVLSDDEELVDDSSGETDWDARKTELAGMSGDDLKALAREWKSAGWDITIGGKKSELVDRLVAIEQEAAEQQEDSGDETLSDDEELIEDEELIIEDEEEPSRADLLTEEQLKAMDPKDLVKLAKDDFDIDAKARGIKTKGAMVAAILEAQGGGGGEDEPPF